MKEQQLIELILQSFEHEMGGVEVYETAVQYAQSDDLREEWPKGKALKDGDRRVAGGAGQ